MQHATSRQNARVREAARLIASARERRKSGRCVLEGAHLVSVYAQRYGTPETLLVTDEALAQPEVLALAECFGNRTLIVSAKLLSELALLPADVGVLAVVPVVRPAPGPAADLCLLLDDVQDPGNVGSMLRSAAAAGVGQAMLSRHCAFAWSPKVLRAGQGGHFHLAIHEDVDLAAWARAYRDGGGEVVGTVARGGDDLYATRLTGRVAIALGNEGAGLSAAVAEVVTRRVTIPMPGDIESLNVAAAAAVCLFEVLRQRREAGTRGPSRE
jgi:TrmH family RNA methyltransferase